VRKRKILYIFFYSFLATSTISLFFFNDGIKKDSGTGIIIGSICFALSVLGAAYAFITLDKKPTGEIPD